MSKKTTSDMKYYQKKQYIKIRNLFMDKKYNSVIKEATNYLKQTPNDISIRFMRAKSYRNLEMFEEAIKDLTYNLNLEYNPHSLAELYFIYYYLNMYKEALELLPLLYKTRCLNAYSLSISELVMKLQLGIDIKLKKDDNYIRNQIFNYSTIMALSHIQEHLSFRDENKSYYNKDINLNYLFDLVRNNIKNSKKVNKDEMLEAYYFGISNIGCINNETCNFIKVIVIPNTSNIINMYPTNDVDYNYISTIDIDYDVLFNREKNDKVKKLSQIDKFNNRFKRV